MAVVTRSGVSLATLAPPACNQLTRLAFTDLTAGDMVYLKSDGTFAKADGTAATAPAQWWGMVLRTAKAGQPVTAYHSCEVNYGTALTIGASYYVAATAGSLDTAATTGGTVPAARATGATTVYVFSPKL